MKISIVIPLYNKEKYIERCLKSIRKQVYQDFEIIIVNDGSTDGSADIVRKLALSNLTLIDQKNSGVSAARNTGIAHANGEWIAFIDADDYWEPTYLEEMLTLTKKFPGASLCCSGYGFEGPDGFRPAKLCVPGEGDYRVIDNYFYTTCRGNLPVTASSVMIRKSVLEEIGGFPLGWSMGEDIFVWMRIAIEYQQVICIKNLAIYDESDVESATKTNKVLDVLPHVKALEDWIQCAKVPPEMMREARNLVHRSYIFTALQNIKFGSRANARKLLSNVNVRVSLHYIAALLLTIAPKSLVDKLLRK
ncbi:glycosyltransferase family 2 protein [Pseudoalteromonas rubra]|uniref:glycosyltransferase family 2 protein n=1 Tax=Pseudoalteromonas rubra TaxID=43658 RepID=UPI0014865D36|nr:glycosyltransferase family A protein [Pseudoalteromonas rubra]